MLKRILWVVWQIVWCLPQNLAGLCLYLAHRREAHQMFRGAVVTAWNVQGCASVGCFIFMERHSMQNRRLLVHEYGHTIQSAVLGWLYLPVIQLPSALWFGIPALRNWRRKRGYSYYRFYTERWANRWGEAFCGEPAMGLELID